MIWTQAAIRKLTEDDLRTRVLMPLFRAMGFRDVSLYHGGSREQGKDIVMWRPEDVRERINYVVVVKTGRISGRARGSSSAAEVCFQIQQALGSVYLDPITLQEQTADRCWVVTAAEITKEAAESLRSALSDGQRKLTDFIAGDKLWELIRKHMPGTAAIQQLHEVRETLSDLSSHYDVLTTTGPAGVSVSVVAKHANADVEEPLEFKVSFAFPPTEEGREAYEALQRHFRTGAPVNVSRAYVKDLQVPSLLEEIVGRADGSADLYIGPSSAGKVLLARLFVRTETATVPLFDEMHLRVVQAGTEELTVANDPSDLPWNLRLTIGQGTHEGRLHFSANYGGAQVRRVLEGVRAQAALAQGGILVLEDLESGERSDIAFIPSGKAEPPPAEWVSLVEALTDIEFAMGTTWRLPLGGVTVEDAEAAMRIAAIVKTGEIGLPGGTLRFEMDRSGAEKMLTAYQDGSRHTLVTESEDVSSLWGRQVTLGPVRRYWPEMYMAGEDIETLRARLADETHLGPIPIVLRAPTGTMGKAVYLNWGLGKSLSASDGGVNAP